MVGNVGLTQNGNKYEKSNIGKIIGNFPTAFCAISGTYATLREAIKGDVFEFKGTKAIRAGKTAACAFALVGFCGVVGTAIGYVFDSLVNKNRMAQADGEALRRNMPKTK